MTRVDQFESVFKSAARTPYRYQEIALRRILVVTDLDADGAKVFGDSIRRFLDFLSADGTVDWRDVRGEEYVTVQDLLDLVREHRPHLICTYRNLHSQAWKLPYSLGAHVDVLTQETAAPVLLLPHPERDGVPEHTLESRSSVMAVTDHLAGDARLVNSSVAFTGKGGVLHLVHIEDQATFERYVGIIEKIPSIDTDDARTEILKQLLKEPGDYVDSVKEVLESKGLEIDVETLVTLGHRLSDWTKHIEEKKANLLVLNTKDEDQLAMHGLAYALAVELRRLPLLML